MFVRSPHISSKSFTKVHVTIIFFVHFACSTHIVCVLHTFINYSNFLGISQWHPTAIRILKCESVFVQDTQNCFLFISFTTQGDLRLLLHSLKRDIFIQSTSVPENFFSNKNCSSCIDTCDGNKMFWACTEGASETKNAYESIIIKILPVMQQICLVFYHLWCLGKTAIEIELMRQSTIWTNTYY